MLQRISRDQAFMQTAEVWARRSTCMRRNIGAVVVVNDRIVSTGYNGAPAGADHCDGATCVPEGMIGCTRTLHAETNAIDRVPKEFITTPKKMYCTESPCIPCASRIINGPVKNFTHVYYLNEYRVATGIKNLIMSNIQVFRMTPAGFLIQKDLNSSGELEEKLI